MKVRLSKLSQLNTGFHIAAMIAVKNKLEISLYNDRFPNVLQLKNGQKTNIACTKFNGNNYFCNNSHVNNPLGFLPGSHQDVGHWNTLFPPRIPAG